MKPTYLMIIDLLPSSKLDIVKTLSKEGIMVYDDIQKQNRFRIKCEHDAFCGMFNELVMMKDFQRDYDISTNFEMDRLLDKMFVFENSHITNLVYCKLSNKKLYKHYMKEMKRRRIKWKYIALVIRKKDMAKNAKEERLLKELMPVLKQSQIDYIVIDKWKTVASLRREIVKQVQSMKNNIEAESLKVDRGW
jgi:hypothetical protein